MNGKLEKSVMLPKGLYLNYLHLSVHVMFMTKVKFSRFLNPPFECFFTEVIPLITFDDFRDSSPRHVFIF